MTEAQLLAGAKALLCSLNPNPKAWDEMTVSNKRYFLEQAYLVLKAAEDARK